MNIQTEALYHFLQNRDIEISYFISPDYLKIVEKSSAYKRKNKVLPSITFLLNNYSKIGEDSEQSERLYDLLYALDKYKPELESIAEINELLLAEYKTEKIKGLTKDMTKALVESNEHKITMLSEQITKISKLELCDDGFVKNDVKKDIEMKSIKSDLIPSGFLPNSHPSLSMIARGSVVSVIGDTGYGKSILMCNAIIEQYLAGYNTIFISYEMPKRAVLARMLSNICEVPINEINTENYTTEEAELRLQAGRMVLKYEVDFDKAFNMVLGKKSFDKLPERKNYLKIVAISSAGEDNVDELPDNEEILNMLETYKPDFLTIDLISEVKIKKSLGSYETDLSELVRELNRLALKNSSVVIVVSQPSSSSVSGLIFPKYAKSIRSSASSNILIASTNELMKDNILFVVVEKCRHNMRGIVTPVERQFEYMRFKLMEDMDTVKMEDLFSEMSKEYKKKEGSK